MLKPDFKVELIGGNDKEAACNTSVEVLSRKPATLFSINLTEGGYSWV